MSNQSPSSQSSPNPNLNTTSSTTTANAASPSPTTNTDPTPPLKTVQSVSFGDLENQERTRRFTISSKPSNVNVTNQENITPNQLQSSTPSRKASITNRKNSTSNEALSFLPKSVFPQIQPQPSSSSATSAVTTTTAITTPSKVLSNINTSAISNASSNSNSNTSLRSEIAPTILKTSFSFESQIQPQHSAREPIHRSKQISPSPPPMSPSIEHKSQPTTATSTIPPIPINSSIPININGSKTIDSLNSGSESATNSQNPSRKPSLKRSSNKTIVASPVGPPVPFQQYLSKEDDGKIHILLGCTGSVATIKIPLIIDKFFQIYGNSKISIQLIVTKSASFFLKGLKINKNVKIWRDEDEWGNYIKEFDQQTETTMTSNNNNNNNNLNPNSINNINNKKKHNPFDKMILHNELRRWADIMLIAPLSANTLAKISNGISDNLLTSIIRSWNPSIKKPILVAPAMNTFMYTHPITAKQIRYIESPDFGIEVLKPVEKVLVCGDIGMGGMREWIDIVDIVKKRITIIKLERKRLEEGLAEEEEDDEDEDEDEDKEDDEDEDEDDEDDDDDDEDDDDGEENNNDTTKSNDGNNDQDMIFDINEDEEDEDGKKDQDRHQQEEDESEIDESEQGSTTAQVRIPEVTQNII
ncbi:hypothetical protein DFJ63DRAFT_248653 [Scheffersomyces coipomensis]|uniref:uncharacterized protein n=1 Tax=Scheffersomyces coipomensis TaxID=1788519 RepID=UPI00315C5888